MRANRRRVAPDIQLAVAKMPSQLAPTTGRVAFRVERQSEVFITHAALQTEGPVTIVRECIVPVLEVNSQGC